MHLFYDENPTKRNIIVLLKKSGGMTIDELCKDIKITPMGIRQHLLSLEKKGLATSVTKKHGIGRPGFVYMLTEMADELFPKSYDNFALEMLRDIEQYDGREKIDAIFKWRNDRLFKHRKEALSDKEDIDGIVNGLTDILKSEGNFVELSQHNGYYHLLQYNCPINKIALEFTDACRYELELFRKLIGSDVMRTQNLSEGNPSCLYVIPRA